MLILGLLACSSTPLVLGAASTEPAVEAILGDAPAMRSYASTSTLVRQLNAGGRAAVLVGASEEWTSDLDAVRRDVFAQNALVVVGTSWEALPEAPCLAIGDPDHVPGGRYAKAALREAKLWTQVQGKVLPTADAPAAIRAVQSGACPVAIAYRTDADRVGLASSPVPVGPTPKYPILQLADDAEAAALFDRLTSAHAGEILREHGFTAR